MSEQPIKKTLRALRRERIEFLKALPPEKLLEIVRAADEEEDEKWQKTI